MKSGSEVEVLLKANYIAAASLTLILRAAALGSAIQPTRVAGQHKPTPSPSNVETLQLTSKLFNNTRTIRILLPPRYRDPGNAGMRYPVLYLTEGITVFRPDRINVEELVYKLIEKGDIPPIIVVGIDNGGSTEKTKDPARDRANEFLPYPDVGFAPAHSYAPDPPDPQGKLYPDFLISEVMPLIGRRYRVMTGPSNAGLSGFSYGGVAALYAAMSRPGVFGKLLLESTPLWIGPDRQILKDARAVREWPRPSTLPAARESHPMKLLIKKAGMVLSLLERSSARDRRIQH